jgi:hypothetical protein
MAGNIRVHYTLRDGLRSFQAEGVDQTHILHEASIAPIGSSASQISATSGQVVRRIGLNWECHDFSHLKAAGGIKRCRES